MLCLYISGCSIVWCECWIVLSVSFDCLSLLKTFVNELFLFDRVDRVGVHVRFDECG